jgi:undecaprenyl-diphosphatase
VSIVEAIILGIVQGLTEFLPVSSSGHLVFLHEIFGANRNDLAFDVALHVGTLSALIIYFWSDLLGFAKAVISRSDKSRLVWLLALATIPAAIFGYLLESAAENAFRSTTLVAFNLIVFGLVMLLAESYYKKNSRHTLLDKISRNQAFAVGLAQALAIVPGVSRSGSTITFGMFAGLDRVAATRFSFLLGIPIIAGAALKVLLDTSSSAFEGQLGIFIVGILTAFVSGFFAIKFMLKFLSNHGLHIFAYYRIGFGVLILLVTALFN